MARPVSGDVRGMLAELRTAVEDMARYQYKSGYVDAAHDSLPDDAAKTIRYAMDNRKLAATSDALGSLQIVQAKLRALEESLKSE